MQKHLTKHKPEEKEEVEQSESKNNSELIKKSDEILESIDEVLEDVDGNLFKEKLEAWAANQGNLKSCGTCACGKFSRCQFS